MSIRPTVICDDCKTKIIEDREAKLGQIKVNIACVAISVMMMIFARGICSSYNVNHNYIVCSDKARDKDSIRQLRAPPYTFHSSLEAWYVHMHMRMEQNPPKK